MDDSDASIVFDAFGRCNHCKGLERRLGNLPVNSPNHQLILAEKIAQIKLDGKGKEYDCVIGLSGGVDSSYVALRVRELGLRPLAVHLDNGWNSDLATRNINKLIENLDLDLQTLVIDWEEFRDLQRSFFLAGVIDIEMLTDHAISTFTRRITRKYKIRWMISGANVATEGIMPITWSHSKSDYWNIRSIHARYGKLPIETFPIANNYETVRSLMVDRFRRFDILSYVPFHRDAAINRLMDEVDWLPYGEKHYESIFTKFYQAYVLPQKFQVDKRLPHYSALITSGLMTREEAISAMEADIYPDEQFRRDLVFVTKKLGFSEKDFLDLMNDSPVEHNQFRSIDRTTQFVGPLLKRLRNRRYVDLSDSKS